jgi:hypothetical protein
MQRSSLLWVQMCAHELAVTTMMYGSPVSAATVGRKMSVRYAGGPVGRSDYAGTGGLRGSTHVCNTCLTNKERHDICVGGAAANPAASSKARTPLCPASTGAMRNVLKPSAW